MTLVELTRKWKDKELSKKEIIEEYKKIKVYQPEEIDGDFFYTRGDGNAWADVTSDGYLNRKERIELKRQLGVL